MAINVTNLGRSGVHDWLIQRVTAVILGGYFVLVMAFLLCNSDMSYETWSQFMSCTPVKIATLLTFLSVAAHAWIGMWTISTDYLIKDGHLLGSVPAFIRIAFQTVCVLLLVASVLWGTLIIWGL